MFVTIFPPRGGGAARPLPSTLSSSGSVRLEHFPPDTDKWAPTRAQCCRHRLSSCSAPARRPVHSPCRGGGGGVPRQCGRHGRSWRACWCSPPSPSPPSRPSPTAPWAPASAAASRTGRPPQLPRPTLSALPRAAPVTTGAVRPICFIRKGKQHLICLSCS